MFRINPEIAPFKVGVTAQQMNRFIEGRRLLPEARDRQPRENQRENNESQGHPETAW
jgi:hypothetical protein